MLTHVVTSPDAYVPGTLGREITLTIGWGAVARIDIVPATCGDPDCDADHGFEGTVAVRRHLAAGQRRRRRRPRARPTRCASPGLCPAAIGGPAVRS